MAGCAVLQERHRQILEEGGTAVSADAGATASPLSHHHCFSRPLHSSAFASPLSLFNIFNLGPYFRPRPTASTPPLPCWCLLIVSFREFSPLSLGLRLCFSRPPPFFFALQNCHCAWILYNTSHSWFRFRLWIPDRPPIVGSQFNVDSYICRVAAGPEVIRFASVQCGHFFSFFTSFF